ncbi:hypothetical protein H5410_035893 [Solanum commersonii]|uniref:Uncharacterized protein n=1 Tax=Solanum commersonii TaxID=4109 RepID=A0A9J5Y367_SOLCO|nr:hypothetical protein H5410_035893 [Solanum commersonii]
MSPDGKYQVGDEIEQSTCRRTLLSKKEQRQLKERRNEDMRITEPIRRVAKRLTQDGDELYQKVDRGVDRSPRLVSELPIGLEIAFCSTVLSLEGKDQVGDDSKREEAEGGRKSNTTKLIVGGIGSTWVQLERVNPSPSPTHSTRENEWVKVVAVLSAATRCSREIESIRGKLLERKFSPTIV